jgi:O-antigen/teichoic acid export membrane protein
MSIERKAISAFKWATAAKVVVQTASWVGTLIVVRLLTPEDYGLMAKIAAVFAIAGVIAELGLGAAIVRAVDIAADDLRKIYGVSLLFASVITVATAAAAPLLARLFQEPQLTWPIACASVQIIITAAAMIPSALATRDLSFRLLSKIEMVAGVTSIASTLVLAWLGAGVWSLVLGSLFGTFARSAALLIVGKCVWPLFSLRGIAEQLKFGLTLVGNRVSYFIVVQSDVLIGSAFLSTTEIGQYSVALQLATLPMSKVMGTINQITLPAMARQQDDPLWVRQSVLKAAGLMSLVAFPILFGISAVAPELVGVLLGSTWLNAVPALTILPLIVPLRMVFGIIFTTSLALGNRKLDLRNTIANLVLIPSGFYIGAHWGISGLCLAWLVSVPAAYAFTVPAALRFLGIPPRDLVTESAPPAVAAVAMYGAVVALRLPLAEQPAIVALGMLSASGAAVYFAVIALVSRRHLASAMSFARALLGGGAPAVAR